jgi:phosphoglycolate phosphatase
MPAQRTVMIGDTTHDLAMARSAGTASIGVTYGAHPRAQLETEGALALVDSVLELHPWLLTKP